MCFILSFILKRDVHLVCFSFNKKQFKFTCSVGILQFIRLIIPELSPPPVDFSIQVLSSGSWPFQQSCTFALPSEVRMGSSSVPLVLGRGEKGHLHASVPAEGLPASRAVPRQPRALASVGSGGGTPGPTQQRAFTLRKGTL